MTRALVTESSLENIGNAIRNKLGVETTYKPSEMAGAISSIPSDMGTKSITANGTYDADDDSLDGYSSVTVNVANSYTAQDEGKVVSSGALVAQTARESEITSNGTYDTTTNDEVTVNVSGGGGGGSTNILSGEVMPSASDGNDGDIFILYSGLGLSVNDRTGYVLTGLTVNDFDKVEADVTLTEYTPGQYYSLFGVSSSSSSGSTGGKTFRFRDGSSNYGAVGYDGTWYYATSGFFKSGESYKVEVTIKSGTQKVVANGTTIVNSTVGGNTTASKEVALLNNNLNGSPSDSGFKGIIYRCKFYSGDTLLRDFVPSVDGEDKVCLYDNVTEEYFYYSKEDKLSLVDSGSIVDTYLKVNGSWLPLIGQDIDDVDLGGGGGESEEVPEDYQRIQYARVGSATTYIMARYKPYAGDTMAAKVKADDWTARTEMAWGGIKTSFSQSSGGRQPINVKSARRYIWTSGYTLHLTDNPSITSNGENEVNIDNLSDGDYDERSYTFDSVPNTDPYVFYGAYSSSAYIINANLYGLKITNSDGLSVVNLVPCRRISDDAVGFYETRTNRFILPTAGSFSAGPDVS